MTPTRALFWGGRRSEKSCPDMVRTKLAGVQRLAPKETHDQKAKEVNQPGGTLMRSDIQGESALKKKVRRANKSLMHGSLFLQWTLPYVRRIFPPFWFYQCYFWKSSPRDLLKRERVCVRIYVYKRARRIREKDLGCSMCVNISSYIFIPWSYLMRCVRLSKLFFSFLTLEDRPTHDRQAKQVVLVFSSI